MKNVIIHSYSIQNLIDRIDRAIERDIEPTVAFIYVSPKYNIRKLVAELNKYPFLVVGSTTVGEIFANEEYGAREKEESMVCMLLDIDSSALSLKLLQVEGEDYYNAGKEVSVWAKKEFSNVALITITSGLNFDNDAYTQGLTENGIEYAFGGSAGDDLILKDTFVFSKDNFSNHGVVSLALNLDKIEIAGARAFGWEGIGRERIISKAYKNIVYEIDGKPAINFYKKYLNITNNDMPQVGIEYPLEVTMRSGLVCYRAVLEINEDDGSLIFAGHVEEKSKVRLASAKGREIIHYVEDSISDLMKNQIDFEPEIALVFPCCSRKQVLGDLAIKEIEATYKNINVPLIGFYAYGEIGAFPNGYAFQNETFVTALLREKE